MESNEASPANETNPTDLVKPERELYRLLMVKLEEENPKMTDSTCAELNKSALSVQTQLRLPGWPSGRY